MEKINFKKKKMKLLPNKQLKLLCAEICYICKETFGDKHAKNKNYRLVRNHCHYTGK